MSGRYVQLMLPPENEAGGDIPDGGVIEVDHTTTNVDIDQFFSIFDTPTRRALQNFYKGGQRQYAGRGRQANAGLLYLSPQLRQSSRLFRELRYQDPVLERFLVDSSRFVTALSERRDDLAALIENLNKTTRAFGNEKGALAELIGRLPPFLRQANTTYVNLRGTLDQLDPFVEASKPVAKKLRPYLAELRPFAREAVPTVRDVRRLIRTPKADNDATELNRTYPGLEQIALLSRQAQRRQGGRGAFPEMREAFRGSAPIVAHGRPYTTDFVGWFDDFSHTGVYDALGSISRSQQYFNAFSLVNGVPVGGLIPGPDRAAAVPQRGQAEAGQALPGRVRGAGGRRVERVLGRAAAGARLPRVRPRHGGDSLMRRLASILLVVATCVGALVLSAAGGEDRNGSRPTRSSSTTRSAS